MLRRLGLVMVLLGTARVAAAQGRILVLTGADGTLDQGALVDAVTIYTRDLGFSVLSEPGAPGEVSAQTLGEVAARVTAENARMAVFYRVRSGEHDLVVYAIEGPAGHAEAHAWRVPELERPAVYREIALKVRAALTGTMSPESAVPAPTPTPPRTSSAPPGPAPPRTSSAPVPSPAAPSPTIAAPSPTPAPAPGATAPAAPPASSAPATTSSAPAGLPGSGVRGQSDGGTLLSVAYALTVPADGNLMRQGIAAGVAHRLGPLEAHAELSLTTEPSQVSAAGVATLLDVPLDLGLRAFVRGRGLALGGGPVLALHLLRASGVAADRESGSAVRLGAGLGADLVGRLLLRPHMWVELRFAVERALPHTRFLLRDAPGIDGGATLVSGFAGLLFALP